MGLTRKQAVAAIEQAEKDFPVGSKVKIKKTGYEGKVASQPFMTSAVDTGYNVYVTVEYDEPVLGASRVDWYPDSLELVSKATSTGGKVDFALETIGKAPIIATFVENNSERIASLAQRLPKVSVGFLEAFKKLAEYEICLREGAKPTAPKVDKRAAIMELISGI